MITIIPALLLSSAVAAGLPDEIFFDPFDDSCMPNPGLRRMLRSDMGYTGDNVHETIPNVGTTEYASIWGHATAGDAEVPWPGRSASSPLIVDFGRHQYIAAHFRVPSGLPPELYGYIARTDYNYTADLTASISTRCGNFELVEPACIASIPGGTFPRWTLNPSSNQCKLMPDTDYYLNVKFTDPDQITFDCPAGIEYCTTGTTNNIGGS